LWFSKTQIYLKQDAINESELHTTTYDKKYKSKISKHTMGFAAKVQNEL
jgi:hypothetical protein